MRKRKEVFMEFSKQVLSGKNGYSKGICFACMLLLLCTMGTCTNAFSVFLPFIEQTGIESAAASTILTVRCFFSIVGMVLVSVFYKYFTYRFGMTLSCLMAACAFGIYALAAVFSVIWFYYFAAAMAGIAYGLGSLIPVSVIIQRWFATDRGFALGICTAGTGVSTICFPPLITLAVKACGLCGAFLLEGAFVAVSAAVIFAILRDTPQEIGKEPFRRGNTITAVKKRRNEYNLPASRWPLMITALLLLGGVSTAAPGHFTVLFISQGYSAVTAALIISVFGIVMMVSKLAYGRITDRFGGQKPSLLFICCISVGCLFCAMGQGQSMVPVLIGAVLIGIGFPMATVGISVFSGELADEDHFGNTMRWFQMLYAGGGMLFSALPGWIYALCGSYITAFMVLACMAAIIVLAVAAVYGHRTATLHGTARRSRTAIRRALQ